MTNPFEDEDQPYLVLVNGEGQHSLWPASIDVPDGWSAALAPSTCGECLAYIERNWADMRPKSLIEATRNGSAR